jgi:phage tail-like protein
MPDYAVYGIHFYGTALYGLPPRFEFTLDYFVANPVNYDRIKVEWQHPSGDWDQMRLVRGNYGFPMDQTEGRLLLEVTDPAADPATYEDTWVTPLRFHYYTMFLRQTVGGNWVRAGNAMALMPQDFGYTDRLYELVPGVFRDEDVYISSSTDQGMLQSYIGIFGYMTDKLRSDLESLRWTATPEKMSQGLLPYLAELLGFPYEAELGGELARRQLLKAVYIYKYKGTQLGLETAANVLTGWIAEADADAPGHVNVTLRADRVNLMENPSFEANAGWWEVEANAAAPARVDPGEANRLYGTYVGAMTASAAGDMSWRTPGGTGGMPATPGRFYTGSVSLRGATVARDAQLFLNWFTDAGAYISTSAGEVANDAAWQRLSVQATAPATAAFAQVVPKVYAAGAGEVHWLDGALFEPGAGGAYFDGSTVMSGTPIADYLWEGSANNSRSHYYHRRAVKNSRLVTRLPDFLPSGMTFTALYAEAL